MSDKGFYTVLVICGIFSLGCLGWMERGPMLAAGHLTVAAASGAPAATNAKSEPPLRTDDPQLQAKMALRLAKVPRQILEEIQLEMRQDSVLMSLEEARAMGKTPPRNFRAACRARHRLLSGEAAFWETMSSSQQDTLEGQYDSDASQRMRLNCIRELGA